jgi:branched-chain amino acid:cation transporter, LIVCS family
MKKYALILSTGFAMFSMFFGSGNLVFPLIVGQQSGGHYLISALGIFLTGVLVPFLGVLAMMLCKGSLSEFFRSIGRVGTFVFSLIALILMGPLGVLPRCILVAHGAFLQVFPSASLIWVSLSACVVIYFLTVNKNKIIPVLGSFLTPLLLVSILAIFILALVKGTLPTVTGSEFAWNSFKVGFFQGYQTMDLLAAFFFSTFVIGHVQRASPEDTSEKTYLKTFLKSAYVGGSILTIVYFFLVLLGSIYAPELKEIAPQEVFGFIALKTLGAYAAPCMCLAIVLACLTTAVVLASLFADFLHKELSQEKVGHRLSLGITLLIAFAMSTLKFSGIMNFLGPLISMIYPALIMLTLVNITHRIWGLKNSHWPTTLTLVAKICSAL